MSIRWTLVCALALHAPSAVAQCQEWTSGFECTGVNGTVNDAITFDDGNGPALYIAGLFSAQIGVGQNIARFDGQQWTSIGSINATVYDLEVYDDGQGPALYACGSFTQAGGQAAIAIAKWSGGAWTSIPGTLSDPGSTSGITAICMQVFDDGSGPQLYVGGNFIDAGTVHVSRIARWNGSAWSSVGGGVNLWVNAFATYDDGSGPALFVGGTFTIAGGVSAYRLAKWNGSWSAVGSGITSPMSGDAWVGALTTYDDGAGPALYVGGRFEQAGGVPIRTLARWNGSAFSEVATFTFGAFAGTITHLGVHDDGTGAALWTAGGFDHIDGSAIRNLARFDGAQWTPAPGALLTASGGASGVDALATWNDGGGPGLVIGGAFWTANALVRPGVTLLRNGVFESIGDERGIRGAVSALQPFDDGNGEQLYVGGTFPYVGGHTAAHLARFDGNEVVPFATVAGGSSPHVTSMLAWDNGSGPALYIGGAFTSVGGFAAVGVARWNGTAWSALGAGLSFPADAAVESLAIFDDGSGPALYAGGTFERSGGASVDQIAKWNGTSWSEVGGGALGDGVFALAAYDDGSGSQLYAGGRILGAGGVTSFYLTRWNGSAWSTVGSGIVGPYASTMVNALRVLDFGAGPKLYVGGDFLDAGGTGAHHLAIWDGAWSAPANALDASVTGVTALDAFDDGAGEGSRLLVGTQVTIPVGSTGVSALWRDDGASWTSLEVGSYSAMFNTSANVRAIAHYAPSGVSSPDLVVGGTFTRAGSQTSWAIARQTGCGEGGKLYCFGDGSGTACPCGNESAVGAREGCLNSLGMGAQLRAHGVSSISADSLVIEGSRMPNASTLYFQGTTRTNGGAGVVFGGGLRCAGGAVLRLKTKFNIDGASHYPEAGDPPISVQGVVLAPGTRTYQSRYRNAFTACVPDLFNLTNGLEILWRP